VELKIEDLVGKRLVGYLDISEMFDSQPDYGSWKPTKPVYPGDWDNALLLVLGTMEDPEYIVLRTYNQDYSMYDEWLLEEPQVDIPMDMNHYKAIGETINLIVDNREKLQETMQSAEKYAFHDTDGKTPLWYVEGLDNYQYEITTDTKVIKIGHNWSDCHYPNSIWEVL